MGILSGVVSYLFGLALNLLDAAINGFLGALGFDLDTFEHYFPAAADYHEVIVGFGVGLLLIMLVFQLFRNFGVMLDIEAEDPLKILGKTTLFLGMILYSRSIVNTLLGLLADPYAIFLNTASTPYEFQLTTLATAMFGSVFVNPFMAIVTLIFMLVLGWQFLKLTVECVERYIVFYFALYCAPVVFATGAFKSTAQIFKSWCRMVASQAMLLLLNIWSIKLFLSFMPVFERDSSNMMFNFLMGYAFLKFAQKADTLLRILGLNTASTGDMVRSLGGTVYRNEETGEAHLVQFASVDNGVMQGTISQIDPKTGKTGEDFAFKAVHSGVPGAETFSAHAVPVSEPSGGAYHMATGADTTIFASAADGAGTAYTPGGTSRMAASPKQESIAATDLPEAAVSPVANQVEQFHMVPNGATAPVSSEALPPGKPPASPPGVETPPPVHPTETPPPVPKPEPPQNQVRRFSRNNPANVEIFRRGGGQEESFERTGPEQESGPQVSPPKKIREVDLK